MSAPSALPQNHGTPADEFEQAVTAMESRDFAGAARVFEKIAANGDRALAARALAYLGRCREEMHDNAATAAAAYERVIAEFRDQTASVADARIRLTRLERSAGRTAVTQTLRPLREDRPAPGSGLGRPSHDGRFLSSTNDGTLSLYNVTSREVSAKISLSPSAGTLPPCDFAPPPTLSPDGSQAAYACELSDSDGSEVRVVRTNAARSNVRRIFRTERDEAVNVMAWNVPDTLLVQVRKPDDGFQLSTVTVGAQVGPVVRRPAPAISASLSPDRAWVIFDSPPEPSSSDRDVFIASASGGDVRPLIAGAFADSMPFWTPDGRGIVFVSDRTGASALWYQRVADGRAQGDSQPARRRSLIRCATTGEGSAASSPARLHGRLTAEDNRRRFSTMQP